MKWDPETGIGRELALAILDGTWMEMVSEVSAEVPPVLHLADEGPLGVAAIAAVTAAAAAVATPANLTMETRDIVQACRPVAVGVDLLLSEQGPDIRCSFLSRQH